MLRHHGKARSCLRAFFNTERGLGEVNNGGRPCFSSCIEIREHITHHDCCSQEGAQLSDV